MKLLNDLAGLPITYVHADIRGIELREALDAFSSGREYQHIFPFVKRFDEALDLSAKPGTSEFINYSLPEIVWDLYAKGGLQGMDHYAKPMKEYIAADRGIKLPPNLKSHSRRWLNATCVMTVYYPQRFQLKISDWVYDSPGRCPSIRLSYEVWHQIVKNKGDRLKDSDMEDYQTLHMPAIC